MSSLLPMAFEGGWPLFAAMAGCRRGCKTGVPVWWHGRVVWPRYRLAGNTRPAAQTRYTFRAGVRLRAGAGGARQPSAGGWAMGGAASAGKRHTDHLSGGGRTAGYLHPVLPACPYWSGPAQDHRNHGYHVADGGDRAGRECVAALAGG